MVKKTVFLALALLLVIVLAACPKPSATPTPTPTLTPTPGLTPGPAATPTPTPAPIKPMTLKVHAWGPKREFTNGWEWWATEITRKTDGAIKFEHFYNESLGASKDQPDNLKAGLFDLAPISPGYHPGKTPLYNVLSLPGTTGDYVAMSKAVVDISALPEIMAEARSWNAKFLFGGAVPSYDYMGRKPVRKVEDLKGLRLRTFGEQAKLAANLGVVPVSMPAPEIYEALERGTLDGSFFPWTYAFGSYGLYEVSKYAALIGIGATVVPFFINQDVWDRLDPRVQQLMLEVAKQVPDIYRKIYDQADEKWLPKFKEKGIEIYDFPPAERAKVKELGGKPLWDAWVKEMEGKGLAGRKVLDVFLAAVAKYEKK